MPNFKMETHNLTAQQARINYEVNNNNSQLMNILFDIKTVSTTRKNLRINYLLDEETVLELESRGFGIILEPSGDSQVIFWDLKNTNVEPKFVNNSLGNILDEIGEEFKDNLGEKTNWGRNQLLEIYNEIVRKKLLKITK